SGPGGFVSMFVLLKSRPGPESYTRTKKEQWGGGWRGSRAVDEWGVKRGPRTPTERRAAFQLQTWPWVRPYDPAPSSGSVVEARPPGGRAFLHLGWHVRATFQRRSRQQAAADQERAVIIGDRRKTHEAPGQLSVAQAQMELDLIPRCSQPLRDPFCGVFSLPPSRE